MYIHNTVISAEAYLEYVTGQHWDLKLPNQLEEMTDIMMITKKTTNFWSYRLSEIDHAMHESPSGIVLVDIFGTTDDDPTMHHTYRWFELPDEDPEVLKEKLNELNKAYATAAPNIVQAL